MEESSELLGRELRVFGLPEPGPPLELATLSTTLALVILDTDVVEDGRDSPEAIIGVHVSNFVRLY